MNKLSLAVTAALAMSATSAMACNCGPARTPLTAAPKALQVVTAPATATPAALVTKGEPTLAVAKDDRWVGTRAGRDLDSRLPTRLSALRGEAEDEVALAEPVKVAKAEGSAKSDAPAKSDTKDTRKRDDDDRPGRGSSGGMNFGSMTFFGAGGAGSSGSQGSTSKPADSSSPSGTSNVVAMTAPTPTSGSSKPAYENKPSNDKPTSGPSSSTPSSTTTATVTGGTSGKPSSGPDKGEQHAANSWGNDSHKGGDKGGQRGGSTTTNFISQYVPAYLPATRTWSDPNASAPRYGFFDSNGDGKADTYGVVWADLNHLNRSGTAAKPGVLGSQYTGSNAWTDPNAGAPVLGWYDKDGDGKPESYGVVYADTRHTPAAQATTSWTVNKPGNGQGQGHGHGGGAGGKPGEGHGHGHGHDGHHGRPPVSKH